MASTPARAGACTQTRVLILLDCWSMVEEGYNGMLLCADRCLRTARGPHHRLSFEIIGLLSDAIGKITSFDTKCVLHSFVKKARK